MRGLGGEEGWRAGELESERVSAVGCIRGVVALWVMSKGTARRQRMCRPNLNQKKCAMQKHFDQLRRKPVVPEDARGFGSKTQ
jgi:hypothetical protein